MSNDEDVTSSAENFAQSAQSFAEAQESKSDKNDDVTTQLLSSVEVSRPLDFPSLILFQSSCFIIRK